MIKENTTIIAIESDCLWVEAVQNSTCGSCNARAGCGQRLLAGIWAQTSRIRVLRHSDDQTSYHVGDDIDICIPDDVVVKGSLFIYLFPLLGLLLSSGLVDYWFGRELLTAGAGLIGLIGGGLVVKIVTGVLSNKRQLQPTVARGIVAVMGNITMQNIHIKDKSTRSEL